METTTSPRATTTSTAMQYGLLTGIVSILYTFVLFVTGQTANSLLGFLGILILIAGIALAQRSFRSKNGGFMSYGEGVGIGALLSLVSGILSALFSYVYREFIDPGVAQQMVEQMRSKLEQGGNMSDAQIDQAIAMSQKFSTGPIGVVIGVVFALILGTILSLIVSAFLKHSKPEFE